MPDAEAAFRRALDLANAGRRDEALEALAPLTGHAPALTLAGRLLRLGGRHAQALDLLEKSLALDPKQAAALEELGAALKGLDRPEEAAAAYGRALDLDPKRLVALNNRAALWNELGESEKALWDADRALAIRPGLPPPLRHRARALIKLKRFEEALASAGQAAALDPGNADSHAVHGAALIALKQYGEALRSLDLALTIDGRRAQAHADRATALSNLRRFPEGLAAMDRAVALSPGNSEILLQRAYFRLLLHQFRGGWEDYEHRWDTPGFRDKSMNAAVGKVFDNPQRFNRREDLAGKRVLLLTEQGAGDHIMFASMIPDLAASAAAVACINGPRLGGLFEQSFPGVENVEGGLRSLDAGRFDAVIALGSLGHLYRNDLSDFPRRPYLRPSEAMAAAWRERLGPKTTPLRIGLCWRGGGIHTGTAARSMSLEDLRPLLERPDCEFVCMMYGDVDDEVMAFNQTLARPIKLLPHQDLDNFHTLAAVVLGLDLIVSVQTTLIHLSGALGAPCLVMVPYIPEWRYGTEGSTMPWYPDSLNLLRQAEKGNWGPTIAQVGAELDRRAGGG